MTTKDTAVLTGVAVVAALVTAMASAARWQLRHWPEVVHQEVAKIVQAEKVTR